MSGQEYDERPGWDGAGYYYECPICPEIIKCTDPMDPDLLVGMTLTDVQHGREEGAQSFLHALSAQMLAKARERDDKRLRDHLKDVHTMDEVLDQWMVAKRAVKDVALYAGRLFRDGAVSGPRVSHELMDLVKEAL